MDKEYGLDDFIRFGEFSNMTVREAANYKAHLLFTMQNGTVFNLDAEALTYVKKRMHER